MTRVSDSLSARLFARRGGWLRGLWLGVVAGVLGLYAIALPTRYNELTTVIGIPDFANAQLTLSELGFLQENEISLSLYAGYFLFMEIAFALGFAAIGFYFFLRRSSDPLTFFAAFTMVAFGVIIPPPLRALDTPGSPWVGAVHLVQILGWACFFTGFFIFPNGRFVPRIARFFPILCALYGVAWFLIPQANIFDWRLFDAVRVLFAFFAFGVGVQVYRYLFVSTPLQRQQTKWVLFGFTLATLGILIFVLPYLFFPSLTDTGSPRVIYLMVGIPFFSNSILLIPISLAIAIRRNRLWQIDPLINRTAVYLTLTGMLATVYLSSVILLQQLFRFVSGVGNEIAIILSTLGIAALFNPLRARIQRIIDRRFYRKKYDAQKVLAAFAEQARDETDLDKLAEHLVDVVQETMQPESVSLWLKPVKPDGIPTVVAGEVVARKKAMSDKSK